MDSKKVLLATIATLGVIATIYLFVEVKIDVDEYIH